MKSIKNKMINHSVSGKKFEHFIHGVLSKNNFNVLSQVTIKDKRFRQMLNERTVDFKIKYGEMVRIFEADGKIHGTLEQPTKTTLDRNADFELANLPYVLINQESIKELRKIMLDENKLKNITIPDLTEFLITYRAWEEYSKHLSQKRALLI